MSYNTLMLTAALTGNYGMGKSTVLEQFKTLGAFTLSADGVVAQLLEEPQILEQVRALVGNYVFDPEGRLVKARLARIVFMDRGIRQAMEALLHPLVFDHVNEALECANRPVAVVEVPLLFECGYQERFDKSIAVYADFTTIVKRMRDCGITRDDIMLRQSCQMAAQDKIRLSDYSIDNNGSEEQTRQQVSEVYHHLLATAKRN